MRTNEYIKKIRSVIIVFLLIAPCIAFPKTITSSKVTFKLYYKQTNKEFIKGAFGKVNGNFRFDPEHLSSSFFNVTLDVGSISTGSNRKDSLLKSIHFFNWQHYPTITFNSTGVFIEDHDNKIYRVEGTLTIKDISKPVFIRFAASDDRAGHIFKGRLDINRLYYHITASPGIAEEASIYIEAGDL